MISRILEPIANRRSVLAFNSQIISDESINLIFEAARWAPSSYNEQPWRFYYASRSNPEAFNKILSSLAPGNAEWAKDSSLLIITVAKKHLTINGKENTYSMHDTGMATANLLIQAQALGLVSHVMGGFNKSVANELLNLSDEFIPLTVVAIGQQGDIAELSDSNRTRENAPRQRKQKEEIAIELK
jgi:nitroreductase